MKKLFYMAGTAVIFCIGCSERDSGILFSSPQPTDTPEMASFPDGLQGEYASDQDSNLLVVRSDGMYRLVRYRTVSHINELDSASELIGDTLVRDRKEKLEQRVSRIGDSLLVDMVLTDTLFRFDEKHQLRKFRSIYVLNTRHEEGWQATTLEKKRKQLIWSRLGGDEAGLLKELSDSYTDSVPYQFELKSSGFRKFLRADGFRNADTFVVRNSALRSVKMRIPEKNRQ